MGGHRSSHAESRAFLRSVASAQVDSGTLMSLRGSQQKTLVVYQIQAREGAHWFGVSERARSSTVVVVVCIVCTAATTISPCMSKSLPSSCLKNRTAARESVLQYCGG